MVFDHMFSLFGSGASPEERQTRRSEDLSILDFVQNSTKRLSMRLYPADRVRLLKESPDGGGSMLDNSLVIYGSPMGNPNQHNHKRVPFLVAGHAGGPSRAVFT